MTSTLFRIALSSSSQIFKSKRVSGNHMAQGVKEQIGAVATVEAEAHLVKVGLQVLCADAIPCSDDATLQEREGGFDSIGMNVSSKADVLFCAVIHSLMPSVAHGLAIRAVIVGDDHVNIFRNVLLDVPRQSSTLGIFCMEEAYRPAALTNTNHDLLVAVAESGFAETALLLAADVGFVHFDSTVQHWPLRFHHSATNAMAEVPRGFVADSDGALHLVRGKPLTGLAEQMSGNEPLEQGQVGIVEDCASGHAKLVVALLAVQELRGESRQFACMATRALGANRPTQPLKQFAAAVIRIKSGSDV